MAGKKQARVTLREFRAAFNEVARQNFLVKMPKGFKKELESVFPSRDPGASVTARQFYAHARNTALGERRRNEGISLKLGRGPEDEKARFRLHLALRVMEAMPALKELFESARKESAPPKPGNAGERAAEPPSLAERVDRLERENAALRRQSGQGHDDSDAKIRKWYEENDTRIGGDHDAAPRPGLRD